MPSIGEEGGSFTPEASYVLPEDGSSAGLSPRSSTRRGTGGRTGQRAEGRWVWVPDAPPLPPPEPGPPLYGHQQELLRLLTMRLREAIEAADYKGVMRYADWIRDTASGGDRYVKAVRMWRLLQRHTR